MDLVKKLRNLLKVNLKPTVYHGTRAAKEIMGSGFKPSKGGNLGPGTYVTNDLDIAQGYADGFRAKTAAEQRAKLKTKPTVLKGQLPAGTKLVDLGKLPSNLKGFDTLQDFVAAAKTQGYQGAGYNTRTMNETILFDERIANQAFKTGGPRRVPVMRDATKGLAFEYITLPLIKALLQSMGRSGQSRMSRNLLGKEAPVYKTPYNK